MDEFVEKCWDYTHKIKRIEDLVDDFDSYGLQVERNHNYAVITKRIDNIQNGIIIQNCKIA